MLRDTILCVCTCKTLVFIACFAAGVIGFMPYKVD